MKSLAKVIIRPQREVYREEDMGPELFLLKSVLYRRKDIQVQNISGQTLRCSWFIRENGSVRQPCVVYCHGNCGSRIDAFDLLEILLPQGMSVFWFDFTGSGNSDGKYISYGHFEQFDIKAVVEYLRDQPSVLSISLWGRSMGAASILMYCSTDPEISSIIADSPFDNLYEVCKHLALSYRLIPSALTNYMLKKVRFKICELADFDIASVNPVDFAPMCTIPAIFIHAEDDELINIKNMQAVFTAYGGENTKLKVAGGHNSSRPDWVLEYACRHIASNWHKSTLPLLSQFARTNITGPNCYFKSNVTFDDSIEIMDEEETHTTAELTIKADLPTITAEFRDRVVQHSIMLNKKKSWDFVDCHEGSTGNKTPFKTV